MQTSTCGLAAFVENLPPSLQLQISIHIYRNLFKTHEFFTKIRNKRMLSFIG